MAATNPEISPMTPPPSPTTNELRSSPASIISSQIFSTCASDFDFSPDGIRINRGEKFSELKLSPTRSLNNRAEISSTITAQRFLFFQAEDGIRDLTVTGVQTCALPISHTQAAPAAAPGGARPGACGDGAPRHLLRLGRHLQRGPARDVRAHPR